VADTGAGVEFMLNWCSDASNLSTVLKFTGDLIEQTLVITSVVTCCTKKKYRSSSSTSVPKRHLRTSGLILPCIVSALVFKKLLHKRYSMSASSSEGNITSEDTLSYVAGYNVSSS